jgi:hypothetical protein
LNDWVGRYRLVYSAELREWYEAGIRAAAESEAAIESALAEADREAQVAEVTIAAGTICSHAAGVEYYRAPLAIVGDRATFVKPTGAQVTLELDTDGIIAHEPGKPPMRFVRGPSGERAAASGNPPCSTTD